MRKYIALTFLSIFFLLSCNSDQNNEDLKFCIIFPCGIYPEIKDTIWANEILILGSKVKVSGEVKSRVDSMLRSMGGSKAFVRCEFADEKVMEIKIFMLYQAVQHQALFYLTFFDKSEEIINEKASLFEEDYLTPIKLDTNYYK